MDITLIRVVLKSGKIVEMTVEEAADMAEQLGAIGSLGKKPVPAPVHPHPILPVMPSPSIPVMQQPWPMPTTPLPQQPWNPWEPTWEPTWTHPVYYRHLEITCESSVICSRHTA